MTQRLYKKHDIIDVNEETKLISIFIKLALEPNVKGWEVNKDNSSIQSKPHALTKRPICRGIAKNKSNITFQQIHDYYKRGYKEEQPNNENLMYHIDDDHDVKMYHWDNNSSVVSDRNYQHMSTRLKIMNYKSMDGTEYNITGFIRYNISETHPLYQSPSNKCIRGKWEYGRLFCQRVNAANNDFMCVYIFYTSHLGGWIPNKLEYTLQLQWTKQIMSKLDTLLKIDVLKRLQNRKDKGYKQMQSILVPTDKKSKPYEEKGFEDNISIQVAKLHPNNLNEAIQTLNNKQNNNDNDE
eukprot:524122_1